jgi:6-phosphogluconolactonase
MKSIVRVFQNADGLSRAAARLVVEAAAESIAARGQFTLALNGGQTPLQLLELLGTEYRTKIDWERCHLFWGDERCVPPDHPESSFGMANAHLLRNVTVPAGQIHRIHGESGPVQAAREYTIALAQHAAPGLSWPRFDLVLLGMGEDGHTASLFPGSDPDAAGPVLPVVAHYQGRPAERVTLVPQVFNSAWLVLFMVTGEAKAATLKRVLSGPFDPGQLPAQRIDPGDGKLIWLADQAAASELPGSLVTPTSSAAA